MKRVALLALVLLGLVGCKKTTTPSDPCIVSDGACDRVGNICTIVGTGNSAFNTPDKGELCTDLYQPVDIAFDAQGRLTFSDQNNLRIRRRDTDGIVRVVAGNGNLSGDPPPGSSATSFPMYHPSELVFDDFGNLYVAIFHRHQVARITTLGQFVPVASLGEGFAGDGGPATECLLAEPRGVAVDGAGNVFIADSGNNRIRKVTAATGIITTIAGSDSGYAGDGGPAANARLSYPQSLVMDPSGNLVVADTRNNVIRRIDLSTGIIETIAGDSFGRFRGDGGSARSASLRRPEDVGYSPEGLLYIADSGNHCIRRVDSAGNISTVAGVGAAPGFDGDGGPATNAHLDTPAGIGFDAQGNLWIADTFNNRIRRVRK